MNDKSAAESKEEKSGDCVCLECYKIKCKSRSNPKEYCNEMRRNDEKSDYGNARRLG